MSIKDDDDFIDDVKKVVHSYARDSLKDLKIRMREERWLRRTEENKSFIIESAINDGLREDCSFGRRPWKIGEIKDE